MQFHIFNFKEELTNKSDVFFNIFYCIRYLPLIIFSHDWFILDDYGIYLFLKNFSFGRTLYSINKTIVPYIVFGLIILVSFVYFSFYIYMSRLKGTDKKNIDFRHRNFILNLTFYSHFYFTHFIIEYSFSNILQRTCIDKSENYSLINSNTTINDGNRSYSNCYIIHPILCAFASISILFNLFFLIWFEICLVSPHRLKQNDFHGDILTLRKAYIYIPLLTIYLQIEKIFFLNKILLIFKLISRIVIFIFIIIKLKNLRKTTNFKIEIFLESFCAISIFIETIYFYVFYTMNSESAASFISDPENFNIFYTKKFILLKILIQIVLSVCITDIFEDKEISNITNFYKKVSQLHESRDIIFDVQTVIFFIYNFENFSEKIKSKFLLNFLFFLNQHKNKTKCQEINCECELIFHDFKPVKIDTIGVIDQKDYKFDDNYLNDIYGFFKEDKKEKEIIENLENQENFEETNMTRRNLDDFTENKKIFNENNDDDLDLKQPNMYNNNKFSGKISNFSNQNQNQNFHNKFNNFLNLNRNGNQNELENFQMKEKNKNRSPIKNKNELGDNYLLENKSKFEEDLKLKLLFISVLHNFLKNSNKKSKNSQGKNVVEFSLVDILVTAFLRKNFITAFYKISKLLNISNLKNSYIAKIRLSLVKLEIINEYYKQNKHLDHHNLNVQKIEIRNMDNKNKEINIAKNFQLKKELLDNFEKNFEYKNCLKDNEKCLELLKNFNSDYFEKKTKKESFGNYNQVMSSDIFAKKLSKLTNLVEKTNKKIQNIFNFEDSSTLYNELKIKFSLFSKFFQAKSKKDKFSRSHYFNRLNNDEKEKENNNQENGILDGMNERNKTTNIKEKLHHSINFNINKKNSDVRPKYLENFDDNQTSNKIVISEKDFEIQSNNITTNCQNCKGLYHQEDEICKKYIDEKNAICEKSEEEENLEDDEITTKKSQEDKGKYLKKSTPINKSNPKEIKDEMKISKNYIKKYSNKSIFLNEIHEEKNNLSISEDNNLNTTNNSQGKRNLKNFKKIKTAKFLEEDSFHDQNTTFDNKNQHNNFFENEKKSSPSLISEIIPHNPNNTNNININSNNNYYFDKSSSFNKENKLKNIFNNNFMNETEIIEIKNDYNDSNRNIIVLKNSNDRFIIKKFSKFLANELGYNPKELIGRDLDFIMPGKLSEFHQEHVQNKLYKNIYFVKQKEIYFISRSGFCLNYFVRGIVILTLTEKILIYAEVKKVNENKDYYNNNAFISCDEDGGIIAFDKGILNNFYIDLNFMNIVKPNFFKSFFQVEDIFDSYDKKVINIRKKNLNKRKNEGKDWKNRKVLVHINYLKILNRIRKNDFSKIFDLIKSNHPSMENKENFENQVLKNQFFPEFKNKQQENTGFSYLDRLDRAIEDLNDINCEKQFDEENIKKNNNDVQANYINHRIKENIEINNKDSNFENKRVNSLGSKKQINKNVSSEKKPLSSTKRKVSLNNIKTDNCLFYFVNKTKEISKMFIMISIERRNLSKKFYFYDIKFDFSEVKQLLYRRFLIHIGLRKNSELASKTMKKNISFEKNKNFDNSTYSRIRIMKDDSVFTDLKKNTNNITINNTNNIYFNEQNLNLFPIENFENSQKNALDQKDILYECFEKLSYDTDYKFLFNKSKIYPIIKLKEREFIDEIFSLIKKMTIFFYFKINGFIITDSLSEKNFEENLNTIKLFIDFYLLCISRPKSKLDGFNDPISKIKYQDKCINTYLDYNYFDFELFDQLQENFADFKQKNILKSEETEIPITLNPAFCFKKNLFFLLLFMIFFLVMNFYFDDFYKKLIIYFNFTLYSVDLKMYYLKSSQGYLSAFLIKENIIDWSPYDEGKIEYNVELIKNCSTLFLEKYYNFKNIYIKQNSHLFPDYDIIQSYTLFDILNSNWKNSKENKTLYDMLDLFRIYSYTPTYDIQSFYDVKINFENFNQNNLNFNYKSYNGKNISSTLSQILQQQNSIPSTTEKSMYYFLQNTINPTLVKFDQLQIENESNYKNFLNFNKEQIIIILGIVYGLILIYLIYQTIIFLNNYDRIFIRFKYLFNLFFIFGDVLEFKINLLLDVLRDYIDKDISCLLDLTKNLNIEDNFVYPIDQNDNNDNTEYIKVSISEENDLPVQKIINKIETKQIMGMSFPIGNSNKNIKEFLKNSSGENSTLNRSLIGNRRHDTTNNLIQIKFDNSSIELKKDKKIENLNVNEIQEEVLDDKIDKMKNSHSENVKLYKNTKNNSDKTKYEINEYEKNSDYLVKDDNENFISLKIPEIHTVASNKYKKEKKSNLDINSPKKPVINSGLTDDSKKKLNFINKLSISKKFDPSNYSNKVIKFYLENQYFKGIDDELETLGKMKMQNQKNIVGKKIFENEKFRDKKNQSILRIAINQNNQNSFNRLYPIINKDIIFHKKKEIDFNDPNFNKSTENNYMQIHNNSYMNTNPNNFSSNQKSFYFNSINSMRKNKYKNLQKIYNETMHSEANIDGNTNPKNILFTTEGNKNTHGYYETTHSNGFNNVIFSTIGHSNLVSLNNHFESNLLLKNPNYDDKLLVMQNSSVISNKSFNKTLKDKSENKNSQMKKRGEKEKEKNSKDKFSKDEFNKSSQLTHKEDLILENQTEIILHESLKKIKIKKHINIKKPSYYFIIRNFILFLILSIIGFSIAIVFYLYLYFDQIIDIHDFINRLLVRNLRPFEFYFIFRIAALKNKNLYETYINQINKGSSSLGLDISYINEFDYFDSKVNNSDLNFINIEKIKKSKLTEIVGYARDLTIMENNFQSRRFCEYYAFYTMNNFQNFKNILSKISVDKNLFNQENIDLMITEYKANKDEDFYLSNNNCNNVSSGLFDSGLDQFLKAIKSNLMNYFKDLKGYSQDLNASNLSAFDNNKIINFLENDLMRKIEVNLNKILFQVNLMYVQMFEATISYFCDNLNRSFDFLFIILFFCVLFICSFFVSLVWLIIDRPKFLYIKTEEILKNCLSYRMNSVDLEK